MTRLILILCLSGGLFAQHNEIAEIVKKGNAQLKENQVDEAITTFKNGLEQAPGNPYLNYNIGNAFAMKKQFTRARNAYSAAVTFEDTLHQANVYYNIGNTYLYESRLDTAIMYYKRALELNHQDADAKHNLELARAILKEKSKKKQHQQQSQQQQKKQPPSEYAKKLFEQAKDMAAQYRFKDAHQLMISGTLQDPSVQANYGDFIKRLEQVVEALK